MKKVIIGSILGFGVMFGCPGMEGKCGCMAEKQVEHKCGMEKEETKCGMPECKMVTEIPEDKTKEVEKNEKSNSK